MTFTMLRGVEPLLPGRVERHILRERMAALKGSHCDLSDRARQAMAQAADHLSELA